ncbi:MAG TPA: hypothetical protein VGA36_07325 [Nitriliruptorales bacterium]
MPRPGKQQLARREQRIMRGLTAAGVLIAAFLVYALVGSFSSPRESRFDDTLPNPMGGPARTAPGAATGEAALAGLTIDGVDVQMGEVALGVTYVPGWTVANPTDAAVTFLVGQPQVLEGCCPGPVYADGELTQAGQELTVAPGGELLLQFPLQMHPGMDGPHHLAVPLASGDEQTAVHVTGDFTASAPA